MNGFDFDEVQATRILRIPAKLELGQRRESREARRWPGYVYGKKFFESVGAEFRTVDGKEEMLLCDVVYDVVDYDPCGIQRSRAIGLRAVTDLRGDPALSHLEDDDEDIWPGPEIHLITALGMCVARCQLIELYIAQSFLLGISKTQKDQYRTINDLREGWKRKTLGAMLKSIEEAWEINPLVKVNFEIFLANRNKLIHGLTTSDRYDIRTRWGQLELLSFLNFFDVHSRIVKKAFRASYYASIEFGVLHWGRPKGVPKSFLSKNNEKRRRFSLSTSRQNMNRSSEGVPSALTS